MVVLSIICGIIILLPFIIKVKIVCKSQFGACPAQILGKINIYSGKSLFNARRGVKKTIRSEYLISDSSLQFKVPATLQVYLLVKRPVVAFGNGSSPMVLVDRDGLILSAASESALPTITTSEGLKSEGQSVGDKNLKAVALADGVYQMYQVHMSQIQDDSLLVELPGQIRVIFPLDGDAQVLLGSLRLIYSKIQEGGNPAMYSQIDLRFKNPVLR
jgi:hypothetical protein